MLTGRPGGPLGTGSPFGDFVARAHRLGQLVVQPRMGFSDPSTMLTALTAVRRASATTVGTITLDSYTRVGDHESARRALAAGIALNGYPIVAHEPDTNRSVVDGVHGADFPIQVRHGSPRPQKIIRALTLAGLDATEGGPVSYCLPYGRTPLRESVRNWARCCELLTRLRDRGMEPHLETFGGCMMGQLCPPSLLVAISVLEALFFRQHGLRSISLSYAQQTNPAQDREAVLALRRLATQMLPDVDWHVVVYCYMGVFPRTRVGALLLLERAAALAVETGAARLIVKTVAEAQRIPTIAENVEALETAGFAALCARPPRPGAVTDSEVLAEATAMVHAVLALHEDVGRALTEAFSCGTLDVPYCLHPDNAGRATSYLDTDGRLRWSATGSLPIAVMGTATASSRLSSSELLSSLSYVRRRFDLVAQIGAGAETSSTTPIGRTE